MEYDGSIWLGAVRCELLSTMAKQTAATRWPGIVHDMIYDVGQSAAQIPDGPPKFESCASQVALKKMKEEPQAKPEGIRDQKKGKYVETRVGRLHCIREYWF